MFDEFRYGEVVVPATQVRGWLRTKSADMFDVESRITRTASWLLWNCSITRSK
ncbi:hypothetical protein AHiyo8_03880 [Arthrobacter sp. Hiyo8]|nr:hypothetical protein AHiyo8_03880 [Arthrobacter sp. Hiyo8]